jgi:hypothetical protein
MEFLSKLEYSTFSVTNINCPQQMYFCIEKIPKYKLSNMGIRVDLSPEKDLKQFNEISPKLNKILVPEIGKTSPIQSLDGIIEEQLIFTIYLTADAENTSNEKSRVLVCSTEVRVEQEFTKKINNLEIKIKVDSDCNSTYEFEFGHYEKYTKYLY